MKNLHNSKVFKILANSLFKKMSIAFISGMCSRLSCHHCQITVSHGVVY
jgi:hypothetical protein